MAGGIRVGVVGIGWGGNVHVPAFRSVPEYEVAALCGRRADHLAEMAGRLGIETPRPTGRPLSAARTWISSQSRRRLSLHVPMALAAIAAGKHVLCEKPLAVNAAQALEMTQAAEAAGIANAVGFEARWLPERIALAEFVAAGGIGSPFLIQVSTNNGAWHPSAPRRPTGNSALTRVVGISMQWPATISTWCGGSSASPWPWQPTHQRHRASTAFWWPGCRCRYGQYRRHHPPARQRCSRHRERNRAERAWHRLSSRSSRVPRVRSPSTLATMVFTDSPAPPRNDKSNRSRSVRGSPAESLAVDSNYPFARVVGATALMLEEWLPAFSGAPSPVASFRDGLRIQELIDAARASSAGAGWVTCLHAESRERSGDRDRGRLVSGVDASIFREIPQISYHFCMSDLRRGSQAS